MNRKGFTLIEVLIVISILAMLTLLITPNVITMIKKNKIDNYNGVVEAIYKAADLYTTNHKYDIFNRPDDNNMTCNTNSNQTLTFGDKITLQTLISSGDLKSSSGKIVNPCTNLEFGLDTKVIVKFDCLKREFYYQIIDVDGNTFDKKDSC